MSLTKRANSDHQFEQEFSQLAYGRLQDKIYNILPYLVGFEVVKKSEDNDKAIGVFGFKSGDQILYVPVFFINGVIRGMDFLYSKNNQQFYPLSEDFANLFLKDNLHEIGENSGQTKQDVMQSSQLTDIDALVSPPQTGRVATASVIDFVKQANNQVKEGFFELLEKNADYFQSVLRFYSEEDVADALVPAPKKIAEYNLRLIKPDQVKQAAVLSEKDRSDLLKQGFTIHDDRKPEEKSKYGLIQYATHFRNPSDSGTYQYVSAEGELVDGFVFKSLFSLRKLYPKTDALVVTTTVEGKHCAFQAPVSKVWIAENEKNDFSSAFDKLTKPAEAKASSDFKYVLVSPNGECTTPFKIDANYKNNGARVLQISASYFSTSNTKKPFNSFDVPRGNGSSMCCASDSGYRPDEINTIVFTKAKTSGSAFNWGDKNKLYVPADCRLLRVFTDGYDFHSAERLARKDGVSYYDISEDERKKYDTQVAKHVKVWSGVKPADNINVLKLSLGKKGAHSFELFKKGNDCYTMRVGGYGKNYLNKYAAINGLVFDFGLDEVNARNLLKEAKQDSSIKGQFKLAALGDYSQMPPDAPFTVGPNGELVQQDYAAMQVDPGEGQKPDDSATGEFTPSTEEVMRAIQMAEAGQKEIFDTQSIATLAKYVRPNEEINKAMPSLLTAMDQLGRLLFLANWETEAFDESFGESDTPELVALLKDVFSNLGDVVLFFKARMPEIDVSSDSRVDI